MITLTKFLDPISDSPKIQQDLQTNYDKNSTIQTLDLSTQERTIFASVFSLTNQTLLSVYLYSNSI